MRNITISEGEYYHVYNRGMAKQKILDTNKDYARLLFSILYFQSHQTFRNPEFYVRNFVDKGYFDQGRTTEKVVMANTVELVAFCLMPNHFHLVVKEVVAGGLAKYMQRVQNSYTKYFNTKYKKSGHLLQGPYQVVHVESNEQLLHLSAYVHRNPIELAKTDEHSVFISRYQWSSCQDYISANRWGDLLARSVILDQFKRPEAYAQFLDTSTAKADREISKATNAN